MHDAGTHFWDFLTFFLEISTSKATKWDQEIVFLKMGAGHLIEKIS